MADLIKYIVLAICFICLPHHMNASLLKRLGAKRGNHLRKRMQSTNRLFFKGQQFEPVTIATRHTTLVLECNVGGVPSPTVHWLKDGQRIQQGSVHTSHDDSGKYEDHNSYKSGLHFMRLGQTTSRLYLDCVGEKDEAEYTCVAETAYERKTQSTIVSAEKSSELSLFADLDKCSHRRSRASRHTPARVYMWSASRLEYEGARVQLYCRAEGFPAPTITWFDNTGREITEADDNYRVAKNGDLIIRDISWMDNMGTYTCQASNGYGDDSTETFLYPVLRDDGGFPFPS